MSKLGKISDSKLCLNVGDSFYSKNGREYKHHIVAILEDEGQVVFKYFGKRKQWWHYQIESIYGFNSAMDIGLYYKKGRSRA